MTERNLPEWPVEPLTPARRSAIWDQIQSGIAQDGHQPGGGPGADATAPPAAAPDAEALAPVVPIEVARGRRSRRTRGARLWLVAAAGVVVVAGGTTAAVQLLGSQREGTHSVQALSAAVAATQQAASYTAQVTASPTEATNASFCALITATDFGVAWSKTGGLSQATPVQGTACPTGTLETAVYYADGAVVRQTVAHTGDLGDYASAQASSDIAQRQLEADTYLADLQRLLSTATGSVVRHDDGTYTIPTAGATLTHCPWNLSANPAAPCSQPRPVDHVDVQVDGHGRLEEVRFEAAPGSTKGRDLTGDTGADAGYVAVEFSAYGATAMPPVPDAVATAAPDQCTQVDVDTFECAPNSALTTAFEATASATSFEEYLWDQESDGSYSDCGLTAADLDQGYVRIASSEGPDDITISNGHCQGNLWEWRGFLDGIYIPNMHEGQVAYAEMAAQGAFTSALDSTALPGMLQALRDGAPASRTAAGSYVVKVPASLYWGTDDVWLSDSVTLPRSATMDVTVTLAHDGTVESMSATAAAGGESRTRRYAYVNVGQPLTVGFGAENRAAFTTIAAGHADTIPAYDMGTFATMDEADRTYANLNDSADYQNWLATASPDDGEAG